MPTFVLSCKDRGLEMGRSLFEGLLPTVCKIHSLRLIRIKKRPEGLIRQRIEKKKKNKVMMGRENAMDSALFTHLN
jgi:hypothetical protein